VNKRPTRRFFWPALCAALLSLSACGALFRRPEPPRLTLADLKLVETTFFEQKYRLALRVQNPNSFRLAIEGIDYQILIDDRLFGGGVSNKPLTIEGYGSEVWEVEAFSDLRLLLRQFLQLEKGVPESLKYRLKGHVLLKGGGVKLPFDHRGEFSLRGKEKPPKAPTKT
jgi:LEA14-like dessication related protein